MAPPDRSRRAPKPSTGRPSGPRRGPAPDGPKRPYKRREDDDERRPRGPRAEGERRNSYQRRDDGGRPSRPPRAEGERRGSYPRRDDGERRRPERRDGPPRARRDDGDRKPYQRRDDGERKPYARRDSERREADRRGPAPRRSDAPRGPRRDAPVERPQPKQWGGVTRRGARQVTNPTPASDEAKAYERRESSRAPRPTADRWEREPRPVPAPRARKQAAKAKPIRAKALPADVVAEVASVAPTARRAPMLQKRLGDAARHMQHGRDREAAGLLRALAQEVPEAASVRELYGQVLYSLGRYRQAVAELEAFVDLTGSTDQHPMLADSYRALGRHKKVQELWADLKETSPAPDIVAEGRIVAAGSLADQGKLSDAIRLLETAPPVRGRVQERHLRTWFALADLYERSGELSKARALFQRVRREDPEFVDVNERLRALG